MTSAGRKDDDAAPVPGDELKRRFPTADDAEGDELRIEITPNTKLLAGVTKMVESFAANNNVPEDQIFLLNLAVDELLTNYVEYSRKRVRHPRMELTIRVGDGKIVLTLLDTGPPFNPLDAPDPDLTSGVEDRELGGLGLHLVRSYCDRIEHRVIEGKNCVTLEHDLRPAAHGEDQEKRG